MSHCILRVIFFVVPHINILFFLVFAGRQEEPPEAPGAPEEAEEAQGRAEERAQGAQG